MTGHAQSAARSPACWGGAAGPYVLQVLVAQGLVPPQQVRLPSRKGEQSRPLPAGEDSLLFDVCRTLNVQHCHCCTNRLARLSSVPFHPKQSNASLSVHFEIAIHSLKVLQDLDVLPQRCVHPQR